jgi:Domain of unknown function (DUF4124)
MRTGSFLVLMLWAAATPAQTTMYKCVDEQQKVTYSNIPCEKQGLKASGTVTADRVTTMPSSGPAALPTQKLKPPVEMPKDLEKNAK